MKMQLRKMGIELRTIGDTKNLYKDVDLVLASHGMSAKGEVSIDAQIQTAAHALNTMFNSKGHFSVCTVNRCAEVCQIVIPVERQRVYDAIHCVHWNEMTEEYRKMIVAMVLDDFRDVLNFNKEEWENSLNS